jgi:hypothetical protein
MNIPRAANAPPALSLQELECQLQAVLHACDVLAAHLEAERDLATGRGESREVDTLEQALLQVARVRNDVRSACSDLEAMSASPGQSHAPAAA